MPANHCGSQVKEWAKLYPDQVGHLFSTGDRRKPTLPYALDNGCYAAWAAKRCWDSFAWHDYVKSYCNGRGTRQTPLWVVAPDVVGDHEATLRKFNSYRALMLQDFYPKDDVLIPYHTEHYYPEDKSLWYVTGPSPDAFPIAFVAQDGCTPADVPETADVVFIGGTTEWKWENVWRFCDAFPRVHVGRVNTYRKLMHCHECGAMSVDGTGFFRGGPERWSSLKRYLDDTANPNRDRYQLALF
jgi:hypothetical protein